VAKTDSSLINEARNHVPEAWEILLKRHQLPLYSYVAELICDKAAAFDVVQETFKAAVQNIGSLRQEAKFSSWIFGIAHQKCMQHWRRVRREEKLFDPVGSQNELEDSVPGDDLDPRALLLQREQAGEFHVLLERLPAAQRSALLLHVLEDFTIEEIAAIADVPLGTIKSRLHNAKIALRKITKIKP
jgi:RNA polymerase sigma-70 factor (ECF subfamily)